jgi:threonine dehydratase
MSAGNHAQAVAYHANMMGIPATIVMPAQTPFAKVSRTRAFGAEIVLEGRNLNECEGTVNRLISEHGLSLIHPYDDELVMTGQGTAGLEMLSDQDDLDILLVPIGGGGLIGGIATIARDMHPDIKIIGVQTALYPAMKQAVAGQDIACGGDTLAEGIAVKKPGAVTQPVVAKYVDDVLLVDEQALEWAVGALVEQQRVVSEGAGAAGIAAIYQHREIFAGKKVGVVICGGNIDPRLLASILNRNMASDGRLARLRIDISDEPGMLAAITASISRCGGNIVEIYHQRLFYDVPAKLAKIDAVIETRGPDHVTEIIDELRGANFQVRQMDDYSGS